MHIEALDNTIKRAIEAALHASKGKIYGEGGAAQLLALKPGTLQSKMRKLGVNRAKFVPGGSADRGTATSGR